MSASTEIRLTWDGDLRLNGEAGSIQLVLDSASLKGPSPMQALAFALAGCMAMDLVHILNKGRAPVRAVRAVLTGRRAEGEPRRFVRVDLRFAIEGAVSHDQVARAIDLSREKYCSVWHSMRQDIDFSVTFEIANG